MSPAISTAVLDGYPLGEGLDLLASLDVKLVEPAFIKGYVEFDESSFEAPAANHLAAEIKSRHMTTQALSAHMDLSTNESISALRRRIECASFLGAKYLITNAGPHAAVDKIYQHIEAVAPFLEQHDIVLALENPGHGSGDALGTSQGAVSFISTLDLPNVRLNVDIGNFATYAGGINPFPAIKQCLPYASHLHLKDYCTVSDDWHFTALGAGEIDWAQIINVTGNLPMAIELPLRLQRPNKADPIRNGQPVPLDVIKDAIQTSLQTIQKLL
jgi:sugar phosphate isomerase/epimerase